MPRRPNILFIMADDHAAKAIGAYGSRIVETPSIDRIAEGGKRLDHCYVTNSICTPSRASILTGTYNHVNGVTTLVTLLDNRWPNVAKSLQAGGYATAIFGKWHLGEGPRHRPTGFDDWCVLPDQGAYFDPDFIGPDGLRYCRGYATDLIADLSLARSEDRLVGHKCCSTFSTRWAPFSLKRKTAYELRISDWSSDVCSSDLAGRTSPSLSRRAATRPRSSASGISARDRATGRRASTTGACFRTRAPTSTRTSSAPTDCATAAATPPTSSPTCPWTGSPRAIATARSFSCATTRRRIAPSRRHPVMPACSRTRPSRCPRASTTTIRTGRAPREPPGCACAPT